MNAKRDINDISNMSNTAEGKIFKSETTYCDYAHG